MAAVTRLTITLEDYDDSKIMHSSIFGPEEETNTILTLKRSGVDIAVEDVVGPLFHYQLDDNKKYIDLKLRTKAEILEWIENEPYAETVRSFIESGNQALQLSLHYEDSFLKIIRQEQ